MSDKGLSVSDRGPRFSGAAGNGGASLAGRAITVGAAVVAVFGLGTLAAVDVLGSRKEITISVDGVTRPVTTWGDQAHEALAAADLTVGPADKVLVDQQEVDRPQLAAVEQGAVIEVYRARPIQVVRHGKPETVETAEQTVEEILHETGAEAIARTQVVDAQLDIAAKDYIEVVDYTHEGVETYQIPASPFAIEESLSPLDEATFTLPRHADTVQGPPPERDAPGEAAKPEGLRLEITRVSKGTEGQSEDIPFASVTRETADMFEGELQVVQKGQAGRKERLEYVVRRGDDISVRTVVSEEDSAPVDEIVEVGTKKVTPLALIEAGIDPAAPLEEEVNEEGYRSVRFKAPVGTITSSAEIKRIEDEAKPPPVEQIPVGTYSGEDPRGIAQSMLEERGWGSEFSCLLNLWDRESGWNPYASNASSGAYGIPQALPGSKMASAGADWQTNPRTQISWGLGYIAGRYGTPCGAWGFFQSNNWY